VAHFTTEALEFLRTHHGIASAVDLRRCGLSSPAVRTLVEAGNLTTVLKGVYRLPAVTLDEMARCAAVCAAHPELAISGPTAGRLWGLRRLPRDHRIHVLAPPASHPASARWVVPYRTAAVHPRDLVRRADGITVTSRARTALDLARFVPPTDLLSIIEQVIRDGDLDDDELRAVAVDWMSTQRPWIRRFLELLDGRLYGGPAESHGETVLGDALAAAGLVGLVRQYRIDLPGYGPARFDLAVPSVRLAIEVDLHPTHSETAGRRRDASRDVAATQIGWAVERAVEADFDKGMSATTQRLLALVATLRTER
jgi:very-short-patch-repair endonuclease